LLGSTIQAFLTRHGFAAENKSKIIHSDSPSRSPRKRRKYDFEDDSGYAEPERDRTMSREASPVPLYTSEETTELLWTDPHTGQIYIVDARTGNSHKQSDPTPVDPDGVLPYGPQGRTLSRQTARGIGNPDKSAMPEWIQKALEANDIYAVAENRIPSLTHIPAPEPGVAETHQHDCHGARAFSEYLKGGQPYGDSTSASSRRFRKDDLRNAQVIDQVDRKFIACVINNSSTGTAATRRTLVLIDQHAADERVRVEKFLKELCLGYLSNVNAGEDKRGLLRLRDLNPPVPILLTRHEERQLRDLSTRRVFGHWGFHFVEPSMELPETEQGADAESASGYNQVFVRCIPEVVAEKLLLDDELRDFVKAFLAKAESNPPRAEVDAAVNDEDDEFYWLRALRWCPQQLLDLMNSKACRGAIMFNDLLTHGQCEKLVDNLCKTAYPFQCAHGRPSLVPLIDLGEDNARRRRSCRWSRLETP